MIKLFFLAVLIGLTGSVLAQEPGAFAAANYTVDLRGVCPDPLIIQKDWLMQPEHGGFMQLIGGAGTASQGRYEGPLGSTGINLLILEGGGGLGMGDGESPYATLYIGNSKAGVIPHLAMVSTDDALIFSELFPTLAVVAPLAKNPQILLHDPATYPDGFPTIESLIAFAESGRGKIYLGTINSGYGKYLVDSGVPRDVFVEGYAGDMENFVANNGAWLNQGYVTNEVWDLENGRNWERPVGYNLVSEYGYDVYPGALAIATNRLEELAPCLERFVPLVQQAQVDYTNDPAEVNAAIVAFNAAGYGAGFWRTPQGLVDSMIPIALENGIIANDANGTLGSFDFERIAQILEVLTPSLDQRAKADVQPEDIATNQFINPSIGLR
jgi:hypothetical protein